MKRKLLFSCEKEGQIFCTAICRHLPPLTRHTENWFCFKVAAPSAACQSVADMRDLWMKPESMRSVSAALLHLPACERQTGWKTSNENITTGHVGCELIWIKENLGPKKKEREYVLIVTTPRCGVVKALHLQQQACVRHQMTLLCWT